MSEIQDARPTCKRHEGEVVATSAWENRQRQYELEQERAAEELGASAVLPTQPYRQARDEARHAGDEGRGAQKRLARRNEEQYPVR